MFARQMKCCTNFMTRRFQLKPSCNCLIWLFVVKERSLKSIVILRLSILFYKINQGIVPRIREVEILTSQEVKEAIEERGILLANYESLAM